MIKKKLFLFIFCFLFILIGLFLFLFFHNRGEVKAETGQVWETCSSITPDCDHNWDFIMGYRFVPSVNGSVTKLCGYFAGTKTVKLYNSSYTLLRSASVTSSDNWACTAISSVNLNAGETYYVATVLGGSGGCIQQGVNLPSGGRMCGYINVYRSIREAGAEITSAHLEDRFSISGLADIVFVPTCQNNGTVCTGDSDCCSLNCSDDYDGIGSYCCDSGQCSHNAVCYNSGICQGTYVCGSGGWEDHCSNGVQDCDETGVDCGGASCGICPVACEDHNVWGWAWSETIGWLSFSCRNQGTSGDYGVDIDENTYVLSGYAWSENIGWVSFNRTDTGTPPSSPNYGTHLAQADEYGRLTGWARALAACDSVPCSSSGPCTNCGGWDGWIRLDGLTSTGVPVDSYIDSSFEPSEFRGWAWGSDVVGWVSFNNLNCDSDANTISDQGNYSGCSLGENVSDYEVKTSIDFLGNNPPTVSNMLDPDDAEEYCDVGPGLGYVGFEWRYNDVDGDSELKYEFRVNNVNNVNDGNPEMNITVNNPACNDLDPSLNLSCINTQGATIGTTLDFNTTYYWWVRVYDSENDDSGWIAGPSFTTSVHAWPWVNFSWVPTSPAIDEEVQFTDESTVYGGTVKQSWSWAFTNGDPAFSCCNEPNPVVVFSDNGENPVTLEVTDSDGFACDAVKTLNTTLPLPQWIEVAPE